MFAFTKREILVPQPNCSWASKMVLNPAMVADPNLHGTIHMLFRATGPWPQAQIPGKPVPYPIFLGYAVSRDDGNSWDFDFSTPAMQPELEYDQERFRQKLTRNGRMFDYANGCIEDPRLFYFEDELYLSVACRVFPPGPYWDHDDPVQCQMNWVQQDGKSLGMAVVRNDTVTMLYKVNLAALARREYDRAFTLVAPLHQPDVSDDRDVVLFPRRLKMNGKEKIVCIHRPKYPWNYKEGKNLTAPSIFLALADRLEDFYLGKAEEHVFAVPEFPWEANRIGVSWAPMELVPGRWLLPYHGKQDDTVGYTQSFMVLEEQPDGLPKIICRPSERMFYADQPWELEGDFTIPCLFTCSGVLSGDRLLMGYGAADRKVGLLQCSFKDLLAYLERQIQE